MIVGRTRVGWTSDEGQKAGDEKQPDDRLSGLRKVQVDSQVRCSGKQRRHSHD
jgi:hypothetical protein